MARTVGIVDRTDELAAVRSLLLTDEVRLITLTGPAGVGKTRLALEVGADMAQRFADGVVFVDLSLVRNPGLVLEVLAQNLGAQDGPADESLPERLQVALRDRAMLIILDNAEQVLLAASAVAELLAAAPEVTLLVTSREALHLRWERIFRVPPLPLPDLEHLPPLEELSEIPSVALFLQRARTIDPSFALCHDNMRAVAELCVHLDGMPLAIELAAARISLLSPQMILERLGQRLSLLRWRANDLPQRQQTLRSAIAWSYDLLSPEEQTLFRHLGIFAGSFSLRAAEAIAERLGMDPLESLASLVDKSLVQVHGRDQDNVRYVLLETMREYARERLAEAGEQDAAPAEGSSLSLEEMSALVDQTRETAFQLAGPAKYAAKAARSTLLSPREQEVLQRVAHGLSNKQIAREMIVAQSTVAYFLTSIYNKLGVGTRAQAVAVATQRDLVLLNPVTSILGV